VSSSLGALIYTHTHGRGALPHMLLHAGTINHIVSGWASFN
jgi:hypothetical protein